MLKHKNNVATVLAGVLILLVVLGLLALFVSKLFL
jgi:uncharacterized membrane protein YqhA